MKALCAKGREKALQMRKKSSNLSIPGLIIHLRGRDNRKNEYATHSRGERRAESMSANMLASEPSSFAGEALKRDKAIREIEEQTQSFGQSTVALRGLFVQADEGRRNSLNEGFSKLVGMRVSK